MCKYSVGFFPWFSTDLFQFPWKSIEIIVPNTPWFSMDLCHYAEKFPWIFFQWFSMDPSSRKFFMFFRGFFSHGFPWKFLLNPYGGTSSGKAIQTDTKGLGNHVNALSGLLDLSVAL